MSGTSYPCLTHILSLIELMTKVCYLYIYFVIVICPVDTETYVMLPRSNVFTCYMSLLGTSVLWVGGGQEIEPSMALFATPK